MNRIAVGIDLGTTYSCVAYVGRDGRPQVLLNSEGERTTPSVVWFDDDRIVVGDEAKQEASMSPGEVCTFIKREMGSENYRFSCSKGSYRPEQVSACILRKLVNDASERLGQEIQDVVITCPAYFSHQEREATKAAGEIAGLNVLEILNEPTAAAMAYGLTQNHHAEERNILVYDLGGGTFDVTIINVSPKGLNVVCTDGNHLLGGKNWDEVMQGMLVDRLQMSSESAIDLLSDPAASQDMQLLAEKAKKTLTSRTEAQVSYKFEGEKLYAHITREEFDSETESLLQSTIRGTKRALDIARGKGVNRIDDIFLVGGSTYMPQVSAAVERELGITPISYDPDESVAKGAAISALAHLMREQIGDGFTLETDDTGEFTLETEGKLQELADDSGFTLEAVSNILTPCSNVCSRSFGQILLRHSDRVSRIYNLIYRNTNLPVEANMPSYTVEDNQNTVHIQVVDNLVEYPATPEEERILDREGIDPNDARLIWEGNLPIQPGLPAESPIETVFKLDESGLLTIFSRDPASGQEIKGEVQTACTIPAEQLNAMRKELERATIE